MIFNNKYIDYSTKTKTELYQTLILFLILSNRLIVFIGKALLIIALKLKLPILGLVKNTVFKHFCGGETIKEAKRKIQDLGQNNIKTILDYSIEGKNDQSILQQTHNEINAVLEECSQNSLLPFCVFKMTGIARFELLKKLNSNEILSNKEQEEFAIVKNRLHQICAKAKKIQVPILIDAEESWIQNAIDQLVEDMMKNYNQDSVIVYNTVQLYRWDKLKYIKELHKKAQKTKYKLGLKLVRGAYMEKERKRAKNKNYKSPIHINKQECDNDYNTALKYCINHINDISICFGTHNEESTKIAIDLMKKKNIANSDPRIYFSQLLGMSDNISFQLGFFKYNVAKYVPYGPIREIIPYLLRRADENTSVAGQTTRELSLLIKEINRRKIKKE